ncbi:MAG TPA: hypothetical protein VGC45_09550 [Gryllotalpicola sp.]
MSETIRPNPYEAEFLDGPLAGTTESRESAEGAYESPLETYVDVEGLPTLLRYTVETTRTVGETLFVSYRFDAADSDPITSDDQDGYLAPE